MLPFFSIGEIPNYFSMKKRIEKSDAWLGEVDA